MGRITLLSLFLLVLLSFQTRAQEGFNKLKSDILTADSEQKRLEGLIYLGSVYRRTQVDSIYYYADSLSSGSFQNQEFAQLGARFLEAAALYHQGDLQTAIEEFEIVYERFAQAEKRDLQIRCLNFMGIAYLRLREPLQSIETLNTMIQLCGDDPKYFGAKRAAYGNLSNSYRRLREYADAIYSLEQVLALSDEDDIGPIGMTYLNMGQMLIQLREYENALEAFKKVDLENFPSESVKGAFYSGFATSFNFMGNQDSTYYYFQKCYETVSASGHWAQEPKPLLEMAKIDIERNQFQLAEEKIDKASDVLSRHYFEPEAKINLYVTKQLLFEAKADWQQAIVTGNELETYANDRDVIHLAGESFKLLANAYEKIGDESNALKYQKLYSDIQDDPLTRSETLRLQEQKSKLALLRKDEQIEQEASTSQLYKSLSFQVTALTIVLGVLTLFLFRYYRREKEEKITKSGELEKVKEKLGKISSTQSTEYLTLKSKALIKRNDIVYVMSDGPYVEIYLENKEKPEIDRNSLKNLLNELPDNEFVQTHRSFIINVNFVKSIYSTKLLMKDGKEIKLSRNFKPQVLSIIKPEADPELSK